MHEDVSVVVGEVHILPESLMITETSAFILCRIRYFSVQYAAAFSRYTESAEYSTYTFSMETVSRSRWTLLTGKKRDVLLNKHLPKEIIDVSSLNRTRVRSNMWRVWQWAHFEHHDLILLWDAWRTPVQQQHSFSPIIFTEVYILFTIGWWSMRCLQNNRFLISLRFTNISHEPVPLIDCIQECSEER